ncbi:hypothetical protein GCM10027189_11610 [Rufibacter soli]
MYSFSFKPMFWAIRREIESEVFSTAPSAGAWAEAVKAQATKRQSESVKFFMGKEFGWFVDVVGDSENSKEYLIAVFVGFYAFAGVRLHAARY